MPEPSPSGATLRKHRSRRRHREGIRYMAGDVPADLVRALVENGWLGVEEATDSRKLGAVLIDLADCWARGTLESPEV